MCNKLWTCPTLQFPRNPLRGLAQLMVKYWSWRKLRGERPFYLRTARVKNLHRAHGQRNMRCELALKSLHRQLVLRNLAPRTRVDKLEQSKLGREPAQRHLHRALGPREIRAENLRQIAQRTWSANKCSESLRREACRMNLQTPPARRTCFAHYVFCGRATRSSSF